MPRYLVERSFPEGLAIPVDEGGAKACQVVVDGNATEAIRRAAEANRLPVDRITEVRVLDPYFYR
jgi:hypothetical protein